MGPRCTFATAATTPSDAAPCSGSSASVAAWPSHSHAPIPAAATAAAIQISFLRDIFSSPFAMPVSVPPALSARGRHLQNFFLEPWLLVARPLTGLVLRLSGDLLLNCGRRSEPQTRGKTRLRRRNYFFLCSILPLSRVSCGQ